MTKILSLRSKPEKTQSLCFLLPGVLRTTQGSDPRGAYRGIFHGRALRVHHKQVGTFQPLLLFIPQTLPSFPPTLGRMTQGTKRQGTVLDVIGLPAELGRNQG